MIFYRHWILMLIAILTICAGWAIGQIAAEPFVWQMVLAAVNLTAFMVRLAVIHKKSPLRLKIYHAAVIIVMSEAFFLLFVAIGSLAKYAIAAFASSSDVGNNPALSGTAFYPVAAILLGLYGGLVEKNTVVINRFRVPVAGGAGNLAGFAIAQISDIHLGRHFSLGDLTSLMEKAASIDADALVLTGDIFDNDVLNAEAAKIIDGFCSRFPAGIWYIYGNHEYFRDMDIIEKALAATSIRVLRNSAARVPPAEMKNCRPPSLAKSEKALYMVGVDCPSRRKNLTAIAEQYAKIAYAGVPADAVSVLLAHLPTFIDNGHMNGATLVLSGHTHGGQIGIAGLFGVIGRIFGVSAKYTRGVYRLGDTFGYVHAGNGSWFPFRLGCPPEIAVFTLI